MLNPNIKALLLTPICAHTFQMRPLVMDETDTIRIKATGIQQDVIVTLDGQVSFPLTPGDEVIIRRSEDVARIVKFEDKDYYKVLRTKLWGA